MQNHMKVQYGHKSIWLTDWLHCLQYNLRYKSDCYHSINGYNWVCPGFSLPHQTIEEDVQSFTLSHTECVTGTHYFPGISNDFLKL